VKSALNSISWSWAKIVDGEEKPFREEDVFEHGDIESKTSCVDQFDSLIQSREFHIHSSHLIGQSKRSQGFFQQCRLYAASTLLWSKTLLELNIINEYVCTCRLDHRVPASSSRS
jgi:hypothetical protein